MRKRNLKALLIVASLLISTAPLYAQRQQQNVAKLKEDARNFVGIIGSDKTKTQTYCQILDLTAQLARANREKDSKKTKALSQKMDQVQKSLGPEFVALVKGLNRIDLNSPDGREIALIIQSLNQSCPD
jgi:ABC-type transporter Mla subunit MlaD